MMKKIISILLSLSAFTMLASAEDAANTTANTATNTAVNTAAASDQSADAGQPKMKLIQIGTFKTVEENQIFDRNLQIIDKQRQMVQAMRVTVAGMDDEALKAELQAKLDAQVKLLQDNEKAMRDNYGYIFGREYQIIPEVAHLYMWVTEEEAAKLEAKRADAKAAQEAAKTAEGPMPAAQ